MTMNRATTSRAAVLAFAVLTFSTACGSVVEMLSPNGDAPSEVVSDGSRNAEPSTAQVEEADKAAADLMVTDYGFTQISDGPLASGVSFGVVIKNSGDALAGNAKVQISFMDSDDRVVHAYQDYLTAVFPGTSVALGNFAYDATNVSTMKVQVLPGTLDPLLGRSKTLQGEAANFTVTNVTNRKQAAGGLETTATVESSFTMSLTNLTAVAIHRNQSGKIIGGGSSGLDFVPAGGKAALTIASLTESLTPASTDVHVAMTDLTLLD